MTTTIQHQTWGDIPAASKTTISGERFVLTPTGLTPWDRTPSDDEAAQSELTTLAATYPERDSHGHIIGFYNYTPEGGRVSGPHPTVDEALAAKRGLGPDRHNMVCGHVFTSRGTVVSAH